MDITNQIKTFEDACRALNIDPTHLPIVDLLPEKDKKSIIAFYKLTIIIRAINEGWEPDWTDTSQYKYFPWLNYSPRWGGGFHLLVEPDYASGFSFAVPFAFYGSRLCLKSNKLALYVGRQFIDLYNEYLLIDI